MSTSAFKTPSVPDSGPPVDMAGPPGPKDDTATESSGGNIEPIESFEKAGGSVVLEALGVSEDARDLPEEARAGVGDIRRYVENIMAGRSLNATVGNFKEVLDEVREEMGVEGDVSPDAVIERISGVINAWRNLSFVKDPKEKRALFMKLSRAKTSEEMNKVVFEEMERRKVWL